ncbi:hypothetical protein BGX24_002905 [Mortierella sp. AD032]|nr:hypothetical protein BGX24_002905 [Mortierella sp. AD032]
MSLDLNVSWSKTAPAWKKLPDGPNQSIFPAAFSSDEQTMYVFHIDGTNSPYQYNVASGTWALTQITFQNMAWQGLNVVTDPRTGLMYIPGGYNNVNIKLSSPTLTIMEIFDPITLSINQTQLPVLDQVFPVRWYYQNVWSSKRNATLYFGGNYRQGETPLPQGLDNVITAFSPDTSTWFTLTTTGVSPAIRADHCMAANEDGSVVVIYGGRLRNNTVSGEVFILDVERKWTSGVSGPPRMYAACTVAGNQLIVWGGKSADNLLAPPDVMIYNFAANVWVDQYTPPASYASLKPPLKITRTIPPWGTATSSGLGGTVTGTRIPSPNPTPNLNSPSPTPAPVSVGLIAGGVIGGLAMVTAVIGVIFVRYRRNQRRGRGFFVKPTRDDLYESRSLATGAASLSTGWGSDSRRRESLGKDPMESNEEYELERTLMDIEEQKRELEMRQQFLVLQHRAENPDPVSPSSPTSAGLTKVQKRGPSAYVEPEAEYIPIPSRHQVQKAYKAGLFRTHQSPRTNLLAV